MDKNYPKNKDPRPKRRRDKGNPYEIFTVGIETDSPHYYISFTDSRGIHICMEINRSLFELFDRFELDDLSYLNRVDKYHDGRELSDELALKTLEQHSQELDDPFKFDHLHDAIKELPRLQRKRLMLYYFNDYTITEIAHLEGSYLKNTLKGSHLAKNNLVEAIAHSGYNQTIADKLNDIEKQIIEYQSIIDRCEQNKREIEISRETVKKTINTLKEQILSKKNIDQIKLLLHSYVDEIIIDNHSIKATFKVAFSVCIGNNEVEICYNHTVTEARRNLQKSA